MKALINQFLKIKREKLLKEVQLKSVDDIVLFRDKFNKDIKNLINNSFRQEINLNNRKEIINLSNQIKDKISYGMMGIEYIKDYFNDKKYKFNVIIILKSTKIKSFSIYENKSLNGFIFNKGYYNISSDCIIKQNDEVFIIYKEGIASPININEIKLIDNIFQAPLSSENLRAIIDGKAFKGIIALGKETEGFNIDWKMALIGLGIIVIGYLQITGKIDLTAMLALK